MSLCVFCGENNPIYFLEVFERLRNSILVPPGNTLIGNAVVRASYLEGEHLDSIGVREVSMELMNILYPDQ